MILIFLACSPADTATPGIAVLDHAGRGPIAAPLRRPILQVGAVEAQGQVSVYVTGFNPGDKVRVLLGEPGLTCLAMLAPLCVDLSRAVVLLTAPADATGGIRANLPVPPGIVADVTVVLQAVAGPGPSSYATAAVERVVVANGNAPAPALDNLLLLHLDDVGVDKISSYGRPGAPPTPNIDALAASGVRFENAWAYTYCSPSRSALETGRHPRRTGYGENHGAVSNPAELGTSQLTLPEMLRLSPYAAFESELVGKWHLASWASVSGAAHPIVQGFDAWTGTMANLDVALGVLANPGGYYDFEEVQAGLPVEVIGEYATVRSTDQAIAAIAAHAEPWFVQVSFNAAHMPFEEPPAGLVPGGIPPCPDPLEVADAMVKVADAEIGRLLATLTADQLANTTIVFTTDNGTEPEVIHPLLNRSRGKGTMYDGGVQVPLIVVKPGGYAGVTEPALVSVVDLFPTFAELAGVDLTVLPSAMSDAVPLALDGVSLLPYVEPGHPLPSREVIYSETFDDGGPPYDFDKVTARNATHKIVREQNGRVDQLFAYVAGAWDEGPDLLLLLPLSADDQSAYDALSLALDGIAAGLIFDEPDWIEVLPPPDTGVPDTGGP